MVTIKNQKKNQNIASIFFYMLFLFHRESAGALHHGSESISHVGAGLPDDAASALTQRFSEARHAKSSHLP